MSTKLIAALRAARLIHAYSTIQHISENEVEIRDLGEWEVPADEEDDGDYDWKVPTKATINAVRKIADELGWTYSVGEKNWMTFTRRG